MDASYRPQCDQGLDLGEFERYLKQHTFQAELLSASTSTLSDIRKEHNVIISRMHSDMTLYLSGEDKQ